MGKLSLKGWRVQRMKSRQRWSPCLAVRPAASTQAANHHAEHVAAGELAHQVYRRPHPRSAPPPRRWRGATPAPAPGALLPQAPHPCFADMAVERRRRRVLMQLQISSGEKPRRWVRGLRGQQQRDSGLTGYDSAGVSVSTRIGSRRQASA